MGIYAIFLYGYILSERIRKIGGTVASARCKKAEASVPTSGLHTPVWTWHVLLVIVCVCVGGFWGKGSRNPTKDMLS